MPELESESRELDVSGFLDIVLRRRWIVISITVAMFVSSVLYVFTAKPIFQASSLLLIEKSRTDRVLFSGNNDLMFQDTEDFYPTQYKLLKSDSLVQKVYERLHLESIEDFKQPDGNKKLENAVAISPVFRSRLVYVKASSHDPQLAAKIANSLSQAFVEQNLSNQLFMSQGVLQALQIGQTNSDSRRVYETLPAVVNNQLLQTLKAEYAKLQAQAADMSARYTPKHPSVLAVKSNMAAIQAQVQAETDRIVQSLKTELSGQLASNNVRIIDAAEIPRNPIWPKKVLILFAGIFGGMLLGIFVGLFIEVLDQSIRTQEDVENKLQLPFLGAVPHSPLPSNAKIYNTLVAEKLSLSSEAFRNLRTMIDFAGVGGHSKQFFVTSTVQEEGKSFVASNLAVAFAQLGQEVLLIDGDLRRPKLHKNFWLSNERGVSDFLATGKDVEELPSLIQPTDIPTLKVLVCGARPPNPSELLNTPRLGALVAWASSRYDRLIVDCTPMYPIHDTLLWSRYVRSCVFVVRYGRTRAPLIRKACKKLDDGGIKTLGTVVNGTKLGGLGYTHYGYYYQQYYHHYSQETEVKQETDKV